MFERIKALRLSVIKQVELEASKYPNAISLAQGIPDFDTPECIKRRVVNALERGVVAKYSLAPGLPELRELIEQDLAREGMFYDWKNEIVATAGSIEAITSTLLALTNPGDEVIIPTPTYTSYREVITLAGCTPVFVPLNEEKGWSFEIEKFRQAVSPKTKAIFYCNPNNPTGTIYSKKQLTELAELALENNVFLISDEVYKDFVYSNAQVYSLAQNVKYRRNLIRIFGFSKAYAMTGWRCGYLHSDESNVRQILKVHDSLVTCAPVISQYAAMGALEMGEKDLRSFVSEYKDRRDIMCERLEKLESIFSFTKPDSAYFVFPRIKDNKLSNDSWKFVRALLAEAQVALVPGIAFGPNGEKHVRISFGRSKSDINSAFDRVEKLFGF